MVLLILGSVGRVNRVGRVGKMGKNVNERGGGGRALRAEIAGLATERESRWRARKPRVSECNVSLLTDC